MKIKSLLTPDCGASVLEEKVGTWCPQEGGGGGEGEGGLSLKVSSLAKMVTFKKIK